MATFQEIKHRPHDISGCVNPEHCTFEFLNGIWYPILGKFNLPEQKRKIEEQFNQYRESLDKDATLFKYALCMSNDMESLRMFFMCELKAEEDLTDDQKSIWVDYLQELYNADRRERERELRNVSNLASIW